MIVLNSKSIVVDYTVFSTKQNLSNSSIFLTFKSLMKA